MLSCHWLLAFRLRKMSMPHSHGFRMGDGSPEMNAGFGDDPKLEKMRLDSWLKSIASAFS
jgi:hypothetical protein